MKRTLIFILLLVAPLAYAQHIKLDKREGKVSPEEAALAQYEPDTTASAVVLYDYTYVKTGNLMPISASPMPTKGNRYSTSRLSPITWRTASW